MKKCTKCKKYYPETDEYFYYKNKNNHELGLLSWCKKCMIERQKEYYKQNKTEIMEHYNQYKKDKPEINRNNVRKYRAKNKEKLKIMRKEWEKNNKDKLKEYQHRTHDITENEWNVCKEFFNYECAYCGISETDAEKQTGNRLHKEHVQHDGSNTIDNCIPACKNCNSSKHTRTLDDWYSPNNDFISFDQDRLDRILKWINGDWKLSQKQN